MLSTSLPFYIRVLVSLPHFWVRYSVVHLVPFRLMLVAKMSSQKEEVESVSSRAGIKTELGVEFHPLLADKLQEHFPNYIDVSKYLTFT